MVIIKMRIKKAAKQQHRYNTTKYILLFKNIKSKSK